MTAIDEFLKSPHSGYELDDNGPGHWSRLSDHMSSESELSSHLTKLVSTIFDTFHAYRTGTTREAVSLYETPCMNDIPRPSIVIKGR